MGEAQNDIIRSAPHPVCDLCGSEGASLYSGMPDRLFGASGLWNLRRCTNQKCGLIWLDPQPLKEEIHKAYKDYYTHGAPAAGGPGRAGALARDLLALPFRFPFSPQLLLKRAIAAHLGYAFGYPAPGADGPLAVLARLHPGRVADTDFEVMYLKANACGRLLDVGCGSGRFILGMQDRGWSVEGVDTDGEAVKIAAKAGLAVRNGQLKDAGFPAGNYQAVTLSHLIEHVHDPLALLEECHRLLAPGGRLVVVTPNSASFGHKAYGRNCMHLDPPRHLHSYNSRCLRSLVGRAGFDTMEQTTTVRAANDVFMGSRDIALKGRHLMGGFQPLAARAWARAMQFAEWGRLRTDPECGEELALLATK